MTKEKILLQIAQLKNHYSGLYFDGEDEAFYRVAGTLLFTATYKNETIEDIYQILVLIPKAYPLKLPLVKEAGGRIPPDFHTNPDGTLCLEAPIKLYMVFNENHTLLHFVNNCALPYFYSFSYREKYGRLPFGDWAHGGEGLIQMYKEFFQLTYDQTALALIKILAENNYKGSSLCPCHSKKKLHQCHGPILKQIQHLQGSKYYAGEYVQMLSHLREKKNQVDKKLISGTAFKKAQKLYRA